MKTTFGLAGDAALALRGGWAYGAHVGDSRVYRIRGQEITQLTEDHSLVNELVRRGKLKRDQVEGSPYNEYKNAVTRAVGVYPSVEGDTLDFDVLREDLRFLRTKFDRPVISWHDPNFGVRFDDYMDAIEDAVPPGSIAMGVSPP